MKLPCRHCERWLQLTAFTMSRNYDDIWSTCIARGANLACITCRHTLGHESIPAAVIFCDRCQQMKRKKDYAEDMRGRWMLMQQDKEIHCKQCAGDVSTKGRQPVDEQKHRCCGQFCSQTEQQLTWSELHFLPEDLVHAEARQETARCARCKVREDSQLSSLEFECDKCHKHMELGNFSAIVCRQVLQGERRSKKRCYECQYPQCCVVGCTSRPDVAISPNHVDLNGKWYCHDHRYPPCRVCRKPRPASQIGGKIRFKQWICGTCTEAGTEREELRMVESFLDSAREPPKTDATVPEQPCGPPSAKAAHRQCPLCKGRQPDVHFRHMAIICYSCEFPKCAACSRQRKEAEGPLHKQKHKEALVLEPWYLVRLFYM